MNKEAIKGIIFNAIGVASGVLLANLVTEKVIKDVKPETGARNRKG